MKPWMTSRDVAAALQLRDLRTARSLMRDLGAVRIGGQLRLPPHALQSLADLQRINSRPEKDHGAREPFPQASRSTRDPSRHVPATLERGWLDSE